MDGSSLSPYPHLSWFANDLSLRPPCTFLLHEYKAVAHRLLVTVKGDANFRWSTKGRDETFQTTEGDLGLFPVDSTRHSLGITAVGHYEGCEVLIPMKHLEHVCEQEGIRSAAAIVPRPIFQDSVLQASLIRLLAGRPPGRLSEDLGTEIAARLVILRLSSMSGCISPDWLTDMGVFPPPVMRLIVERIDSRIHAQPTLDEISNGFGLSRSHFTRKFHRSTGLSLNRFMNRRRIGLSLDLLKTGRQPIAQLSIDLGFSSQSHFTRLFSGLTGLTPSQFRRVQRNMSD